MENKNIVLTRDILMEKVCGYDYVGETKSQIIEVISLGTHNYL